jgi:hypothetical protein
MDTKTPTDTKTGATGSESKDKHEKDHETVREDDKKKQSDWGTNNPQAKR